MAEDYSPIQVVLDVRQFQNERVRHPGGNAKDFFIDNDVGFVAHRQKIRQSLTSIERTLVASSAGRVGFIRVRMREEALAKSHRPINSLFHSTFTPTVGSSGLGEIIVQVSPATIERAVAQVDSAEDVLRYKPAKDKPDVMLPAPSRQRSEVGGIESVSLWGAADRRSFSTTDAVQWFESRAVPRAYRVDLFDSERPAQRYAQAEFDVSGDLFESLQSALDDGLSSGYVAAFLRPDRNSMTRMYIWLVDDPRMRFIVTRQNLRVALDRAGSASLAPKLHQELLAILEAHAAVRRISLPTNLRANATRSGVNASTRTHVFSKPSQGAEYPIVGIIDGGIQQVPRSWIIHDSSLVRAADADFEHGTVIGSLLVDGQALNGPQICPEPDGCWLANLALVPEETRFNSYYSSELDLVTQIELDVADARASVGARVFSFSHNVEEPPGGNPTYTELSQGLDRIALDQDVVFVVSAGNTIGPVRKEWVDNNIAVLSNLASVQGDRITAPADSVLSVAVGALNPPGVAGTIPMAPARYSRRGPGYKQLVKPDVAHYGGVCSNTTSYSGLTSVDHAGRVKSVQGTSYSAPLVAKALARYDLLTKGALTREALIALLIHGAEVPACLEGFSKGDIIRNLVGFGMPVNTQQMINGSQHAATLLFYDRMMPGKDLFFGFDWPRSLVVNGKCRGHALLTLVYAPPISDAFETELVRVNLEAALHRRNPVTGKYDKQGSDTFSDEGTSSHGAMEKELIEDGLKWGVVKQSEYFSARGAGKSSDWRIALKYLVRSDEVFPDDGVPFAMILTISDPKAEAPVYQDMKVGLSVRQVLTGDIRQPSGRVQVRG